MPETDLIARIQAYAGVNGEGAAPIATPVPGFSVVVSASPTPPLPMTYRPIFCLVLQGAKTAEIGRRVLRFAAMESLIVGLDLPATSRIVLATPEQPYVAMALALDRTVLRELAGSIGEGASSGPGPAAVTLPGDAEVLDAMGRLFALIDRPAAIPVLAPLVMREIHYWLLAGRHGAMLAGLVRADSHGARIARAVERIRQDFDRPLAVADLAALSAMSPSAFHAHFRAVTGLSPLQFQKRLRLTDARRRLLDGASVADAAFSVGYESPTQFSRDYARLFGAPPKREVAAARSLDPAEGIAAVAG